MREAGDAEDAIVFRRDLNCSVLVKTFFVVFVNFVVKWGEG